MITDVPMGVFQGKFYAEPGEGKGISFYGLKNARKRNKKDKYFMLKVKGNCRTLIKQ